MTAGTVFLVDDDEAIRDALAWLLRSRGVASQSWNSAEAFLDDYRPDMAGCLVLDIRMSGMSGLQLFDHLKALGCLMPVIFLTGHGDVPLAVQSIKGGAYNFLEKPFDEAELVNCVLGALDTADQTRQLGASRRSVADRLKSLTTREREVMNGILAGKYNKVIAAELNIAMRTVEVHRARIFDKMSVKSAVELAQVLAGESGR